MIHDSWVEITSCICISPDYKGQLKKSNDCLIIFSTQRSNHDDKPKLLATLEIKPNRNTDLLFVVQSSSERR